MQGWSKRNSGKKSKEHQEYMKKKKREMSGDRGRRKGKERQKGREGKRRKEKRKRGEIDRKRERGRAREPACLCVKN